jgi:hypothetical protein
MELSSSLPIELFQNKDIAEKFTCSICLTIPNPDTCKEHSQCGKVFCPKCTEDWAKKNNTCPNCKQGQFTENLRGVKANCKLIFSLMKELMIKCPSNSGCNWIGDWSNMEAHSHVCQEIEAKCENGCGLVLKRKLMSNHNASECIMRNIKCNFCNVPIVYKILTEHTYFCEKNPNRIKKCIFYEIGCTFQGTAPQITDHIKNSTEDHMNLLIKDNKRLKIELNILENKCKNGHTLTEVKTNLISGCNVCGRETDGQYMSCSECSWNSCISCYYFKPFNKKCVSNPQHGMTYINSDSKIAKCFTCKKSIFNGRYHCTICQISVCKKCQLKGQV